MDLSDSQILPPVSKTLYYTEQSRPCTVSDAMGFDGHFEDLVIALANLK